MNQNENPGALYSELKETNLAISVRHKKILLIISLLRLIVFISGVVLTFIGFSSSFLPGLLSLTFFTVLFLFLLKLYSDHSALLEFYLNLVKINENELNSLKGDYSVFADGKEWINPEHSFSYDIDLFGKDSLFQSLNRTVTGFGRRILASWLSDPFVCAENLKERQEAIQELSGMPLWRQKFAAYGMRQAIEEEDIRAILDWLHEDSDSPSNRAMGFIIFFLPLLAVVSLSITIAGYLHYSVFTFVFLFNLLIIASQLKKTNRLHNKVSGKHYYLSSFSTLLNSFRSQEFRSSVLSGIKNEISGYPGSAAERIESLGRIMKAFDSRLNMLVGFALNGLLLWDMHCIRALGKWKKDSEDILPGLLENLGEIDALNSLANFAFNNGGYAWPLISASSVVISAKELGHPLLPAERRICNDLVINNRGDVVIITGANMAGKSTFLRTVAINFVLAMTGAPVCAASMSFSPVKLFTSMRTTDSLSHNESYFYAELRRLKSLRKGIEEDRSVFFILDEILKGTNSADKSIGSRQFLRKCIELGGTGMIATHDTALAETEKDYPGKVFNKCFEIEIDGDKVTFDYLLRDGITTRMNASILMKEMGITD